MTTQSPTTAVPARLLLTTTLSVAILILSGAAWACPDGYIACGERQQLCCPRR